MQDDLNVVLKLDPYNTEARVFMEEIHSFLTPVASSAAATTTPVTSPVKPAYSPAVMTTPIPTTTTSTKLSKNDAVVKEANHSNVTPVKPVTDVPVVTSAAPLTPIQASISIPNTPMTTVKENKNDCIRYKELGNQSCTNGDYTQAISYYSESIAHDSTHYPSYCNRAQAYLKLNKFDLVIQDTTVVVDSVSATVDKALLIKAYYRRSQAYKGLSSDNSSHVLIALNDIEHILSLESTNKIALSEREILKKLLEQATTEENRKNKLKKESIGNNNNVIPTVSTPVTPAVSRPEEKVIKSPAPVTTPSASGLTERNTTKRVGNNTPATAAKPDIIPTTPVPTARVTAPVSSTPSSDKASFNQAEVVSKALNYQENAMQIPTEAPATVVEFERHWKLLRMKPDVFISKYLLKVFKKSTWKKVIKSSLSDQLISFILKHTYEQCIVMNAQPNDAYSILKGMSNNNDSIDMIVSVMSAEDTRYIQLIIDDMVLHYEGASYDPVEVNVLRNIYKVI